MKLALFLQTACFNAYIPQVRCLDDYATMLANQEFIQSHRQSAIAEGHGKISVSI